MAPQVLADSDLRTEAEAVAEALMLRVRKNAAVLRETLSASGAWIADETAPLTANDLKFLTEKFGPLPLSLDVFYRTVGSIKLIPKADYNYGDDVTLEQADGVSLIALDPLQVEAATELTWLVEECSEDPDYPFDEFYFYLSPDYLHKQNISGGMSYSVQLPSPTAQEALDPAVRFERHELSFVKYLRYCFRWGGFPGLDVCEHTDEDDVPLNWRIGFYTVEGPWRPAYRRLPDSLTKGLVDF
ncbi:MAG: hypothetical protein U0105_22630 [Candidatus Obscuribacterales bacterium]